MSLTSSKLLSVRKVLDSGALDIRCVLVSQCTDNVFEFYSHKADKQTLFPMYSITKSIVALGFGFVVQKKGDAFLGEKVFPFCKEYLGIESDVRLQELNFRHILTQTSGWKWREMGAIWGPGNPLWEMEHHHDWIEYVLKHEYSSHPGKHFNYNSGASHLLPYLMGEVLECDVGELFLQKIFFPLGIDRIQWDTDPQERLTGGKGLSLRGTYLLAIGNLILNSGKHQGLQIIPNSWIENCIEKKVHASGFYGEYGFQWWVRPSGIVAAMGFGGQYLLLDLELRLCVVILGNLSKDQFAKPLELFEIIRNETRLS